MPSVRHPRPPLGRPALAGLALTLGLAALATALATAPGEAHAQELEVDFSGRIQSDLRLRLEERSLGPWYARHELPTGVSRNENILKLRLEAEYGLFRGVAEVDFALYGVADDPPGLRNLIRRETLDPFRLDVHALYVEAVDLLPGLDIRFGQQVVMWGQADQFNPTNTLNAMDLEDPLLFGEQQGNLMLKVDYTFLEEFSLSGVLVPIFRPALLPRSAPLGLAAIDRVPFTDAAFRHLIHGQNAYALSDFGAGTVVGRVDPELPDISLDNMQFAFRFAGVLGEQDIALSYYNGFSDFPVAARNTNYLVPEDRCRFAPRALEGGWGPSPDPDGPFVSTLDLNGDTLADSQDCITGTIQTDVTLEYPRLQVLGLNMAGEIPGIGVGYRLEVGVFFPERRTLEIVKDRSLGVGSEENGFDTDYAAYQDEPHIEYDYDFDGIPGGPRPEILSDTPFAKWSLGFDYTFGEAVYLNVQWVHGLPDEVGAGDWITEGMTVRRAAAFENADATFKDCGIPGQGVGYECAWEMLRPRLGDYLVLGADFRFDQGSGLFRLFTIWDLTGMVEERYDVASGTRVRKHHSFFTQDGFSAVIFPELQYQFGYGFEMHLGALIQLGEPHTKFGDPAAGGTQAYVRARYAF